jgi:hypothetical protein
MAGDWIKLEVATPDKPEVARLARKLGVSRSDAFLAIVRVLFWADTNVRDGFVPDLSPTEGDNLAHTLSGTFEALSHHDIGWIEIVDGGMQFVNWDRHNGNSAKKRSSEAKKKQNQRRKCVDVPSNVPEMSPCGGDKDGTREEKRRDNTPISPKGDCEPVDEFNEGRRSRERYKKIGRGERKDVKSLKAWMASHPEELIPRDQFTYSKILEAAVGPMSELEFYRAVERFSRGESS